MLGWMAFGPEQNVSAFGPRLLDQIADLIGVLTNSIPICSRLRHAMRQTVPTASSRLSVIVIVPDKASGWATDNRAPPSDTSQTRTRTATDTCGTYPSCVDDPLATRLAALSAAAEQIKYLHGAPV